MPTTNGTPVELREATNWAENIVHTAINVKAGDRLSGAALRIWETPSPLFESDPESSEQRQAVKLSLDALSL